MYFNRLPVHNIYVLLQIYYQRIFAKKNVVKYYNKIVYSVFDRFAMYIKIMMLHSLWSDIFIFGIMFRAFNVKYLKHLNSLWNGRRL